MAQATRPWIGINTDFVAASKQTRAHFRLPVGYCDAVLQAGGLPIFLPPYEKRPTSRHFSTRWTASCLAAAVIWTRGGWASKRTRPCRSSRPAARTATACSSRPCSNGTCRCLAVGLGMQLLNVIRGGSLYLHLPEDLPRTLPHRDPTGAAHRHAVLLEPGTSIDEIYGGGEIRINSDHHQAVRQIGAGLRLGARSPDGVIEAIEGTDPNHFCIGVQWHPESETASALDMQLFEAFIQACVRQGKTLGMAA